MLSASPGFNPKGYMQTNHDPLDTNPLKQPAEPGGRPVSWFCHICTKMNHLYIKTLIKSIIKSKRREVHFTSSEKESN